MSYFLFVDESGQDRKASPYEVLAGVSVLDRELGRLSREAHDLEVKHFGRRYSLGTSELKGRNLLKKKVFQHAGLNVRVLPEEIRVLAKSALDDGAAASVREWKGLALAKLAYVRDALDLCIKLDCKAFASVVETDSPATTTDGLRKDYAYLFEDSSIFSKISSITIKVS